MLASTVFGVFFIPFLYYVIQSLVDRKKEAAPTTEPPTGNLHVA
jgi:hypothetical protein